MENWKFKKKKSANLLSLLNTFECLENSVKFQSWRSKICVKNSSWEACHKNKDYLDIFHVKFSLNNSKTKNFLSTINNLLQFALSAFFCCCSCVFRQFSFSVPITLNWNNLITLRAFGTIMEHNVFVYRELTAKNKTKTSKLANFSFIIFPCFLLFRSARLAIVIRHFVLVSSHPSPHSIPVFLSTIMWQKRVK